MKPWEKDVLDRLEKEGNPLGWRPTGRDERGDGIMETTLPAGPNAVKHCRMALREDGIHNFPSKVVSLDG